MMSDVSSINFNDLQHRYFYRTSALQAAEMLEAASRRGKVGDDLSHLLRSHVEAPVLEEEEITLRNAFDQLLAFYSLVEIACLIRFLPHPLPTEFQQRAMNVLCDRAVCKYYEAHYPLLLPKLLRLRLGGKQDLHYSAKSVTAAFYLDFLNTNALVEEDQEVGTFLWFLDDGHVGQYSLRDTIEVLGNREEFMARIGRENQKGDALDSSLHGFRKFLAFCTEFEDLLRRCRNFPLVQSAFWHYHAYWFQSMGKQIGEDLRIALHQFEKWEASSNEDSNASRESLEKVGCVLQSLTSGDYGKPLENEYEKAVETLATPVSPLPTPRLVPTPARLTGRFAIAGGLAGLLVLAVGLNMGRLQEWITGVSHATAIITAVASIIVGLISGTAAAIVGIAVRKQIERARILTLREDSERFQQYLLDFIINASVEKSIGIVTKVRADLLRFPKSQIPSQPRRTA